MSRPYPEAEPTREEAIQRLQDTLEQTRNPRTLSDIQARLKCFEVWWRIGRLITHYKVPREEMAEILKP